MKFYITKHALTRGILEIDNEKMADVHVDEGRLHFTCPEVPGFHDYHHGEWYTVREFAIDDAEARRRKKIDSLKRQISKLEKIKFE